MSNEDKTKRKLFDKHFELRREIIKLFPFVVLNSTSAKDDDIIQEYVFTATRGNKKPDLRKYNVRLLAPEVPYKVNPVVLFDQSFPLFQNFIVGNMAFL